jgi:hypothetical protein
LCTQHTFTGSRLCFEITFEIRSSRSGIRHDAQPCTDDNPRKGDGVSFALATDQRKDHGYFILQQRHMIFNLDESIQSSYSHHTQSSTQFQRCKFSSSTPSIYRVPFLGYFSKSCPISAKSSVDNSTSPAPRFSKVRFTFLHGTNGINNE